MDTPPLPAAAGEEAGVSSSLPPHLLAPLAEEEGVWGTEEDWPLCSDKVMLLMSFSTEEAREASGDPEDDSSIPKASW